MQSHGGSLNSSAQDADRQHVMELMDGIGSHALAADAPDESVATWLRHKGANEHMLAIAEACYANDFGCSLEDLGLRECIIENQLWEAGGHPCTPCPVVGSAWPMLDNQRSAHDLYV